MKTVNIHEAKTHLSRLLEEVAQGDPIIIAKAGKPVAKLLRFEDTSLPNRRIGFMKGAYEIPDDFDTMFADEIRSMFEDGPLFPESDSSK